MYIGRSSIRENFLNHFLNGRHEFTVLMKELSNSKQPCKGMYNIIIKVDLYCYTHFYTLIMQCSLTETEQ